MDKTLYLKKILHLSLGIILVILGFLGMVLPFIHGTIPLIVGLILISFESEWLEKKLTELASKNKRTKHWHEKLDVTLKGFFKIDLYKKRKGK
jgi:uncharacterized membrane protein YbaN (DUF454 family)